MRLSRRDLLKLGIGAAGLGLGPVDLFAQSDSLVQRSIPSSGERLPAVGIGTARRYEAVQSEAERAPLRATLREFHALGGTVIDTAP